MKLVMGNAKGGEVVCEKGEGNVRFKEHEKYKMNKMEVQESIRVKNKDSKRSENKPNEAWMKVMKVNML